MSNVRPGSFARAILFLAGRPTTAAFTVLLGAFVLIAVFAEQLASDLPILCKVQGTVYVVPNVTHPPGLQGWNVQRVNAEGEATAGGGDAALSGLLAYATWFAVHAFGVRP